MFDRRRHITRPTAVGSGQLMFRVTLEAVGCGSEGNGRFQPYPQRLPSMP
jgi:hypothetical protein